MRIRRKFHSFLKCLTRQCRKNNRLTSYLLLLILLAYTLVLIFTLNKTINRTNIQDNFESMNKQQYINNTLLEINRKNMT